MEGRWHQHGRERLGLGPQFFPQDEFQGGPIRIPALMPNLAEKGEPE